MRISDWSSDVCSSDLDRQRLGQEQALVDDRPARQRADVEALNLGLYDLFLDAAADEVEGLFELLPAGFVRQRPGDHDLLDLGPGHHCLVADDGHVHRHLTPAIDGVAEVDDLRSEEHTSELQSLMRISYAV